MRKSKLLSVLIFLLIISVALLTGCGSSGYRSIKVFSIEGNVTVNREDKDLTASKNMKLKNNDTVTVSSNSNTVLKLDSDKFIMAKENTTLKLEATGKKNNTKTRIHVSDGGVIVEVKQKLKENESFEIASSNSVMAIRGTQIGFDVSNDNGVVSTNLVTLTGKTEISLLKDDNLKSTNLTECLSLTYESNINESKDIIDMSDLIDNSTIGHISDSDLENVYNTEIREISTYEIDSIVDAVNTFERKPSEYINGTIKITKHPDTVEYGVDPRNYIEVDKEYKELNFYYSQELKGDYLGFDDYGVLAPGTWYCKAKSIDAYRSDPFVFEVVNAEVKFSNLPSSVDYGTDPKTVIKTDKTYKNLEYYYSDSIDGEFKAYDANNPLDLGTYFFKATCFGYESDIYNIEVSKIKANIIFDVFQKNYTGTALLDITLEGNLFDNEFAQITEDIRDDTIYKYFIKITYTDEDDNTYSIFFDKDHRKRFIDFIFSGEQTAKLDIYYCLPYYYEVTSSDSIDFTFENSIDMENSVIMCTHRHQGTADEYRQVDVVLANYYVLDEESQVKLYLKRVQDFTGEIEYVPISDGIHAPFTFKLDNNEILVVETFEYDGVNKNKGYYEYDLDFNRSMFVHTGSLNTNDPVITFNDDGTMNVYYDLEYNGTSDDTMYFATLTTADANGYSDQTYMSLGTNKRFAIFEDLLKNEYEVTKASMVTKFNGVYYSLRNGSAENMRFSPFFNTGYFAKYYVDGEQTIISGVEDYECFDTTNPITIYADGNEFIVSEDCLGENTFSNFIIDGTYESITMDAMICPTFYKWGYETVAFDMEDNPRYLTDDVFAIVKQQMKSKYGITMKGTNKDLLRGMKVSEV